MNKKITLDIVEDILIKEGKTKFDEIVKLVEKQKKQKIDNSEKSAIFTNMNIDKRFINLGDNLWDLRISHPYSKVHLPINELYAKQKRQEFETNSKLDEDMKTFVSNEK